MLRITVNMLTFSFYVYIYIIDKKCKFMIENIKNKDGKLLIEKGLKFERIKRRNKTFIQQPCISRQQPPSASSCFL